MLIYSLTCLSTAQLTALWRFIIFSSSSFPLLFALCLISYQSWVFGFLPVVVNVLKFIMVYPSFTQIPPDGSLSSCSPHLNALPLTYCLFLFLLDRRAEKAVGGREKEESHVQAQVLDEQGDRHRRAQRTSELSMMHGIFGRMSPLWNPSGCNSVDTVPQ